MMANSSTSSSLQNKKRHEFEVGRVNRIQSLPDPILAHILSFLPTEDAVKTLLLRVFGNLWTSSRTLDFSLSVYDFVSFSHLKDKWYINYIDHVLLHHESPTIDKFSLKFSYACRKNTSLSRHYFPRSHFLCKLYSWICYAVNKKVKLLELDMLDYNLSGPLFCYDLPDVLLCSDSLVDLKLVSCMIKSSTAVSMRSLKILSLTTVSLDNKIMVEILSGCPMLERLSLTRCYGLCKLDLTSTCLKYLEVTLSEGDPSKFEISCHNIKSIKIDGSIGRANLTNTMSVVDATLDFFSGGRYSIHEYQSVGLLLDDLMNTKFLTLCHWCILVISMRGLMDGAFSTLGSKVVTLKTRLTKWHMFGIARLLNVSPYLEILAIYIEPSVSILTSDDVMWLKALGIRGQNPWTNEAWLCTHDFNEENFWNTQQYFPCLINHLKCVTLYGCIENLYISELVKFLLRGSPLLERLVIVPDHKSQNMLTISQWLKLCPKASDRVVIDIS